MDVPDWLLKPTKNNRQHIMIMSLIEHVQKAAERRGVDPFLHKQIEKLEKVHLEHALETVDLDDGVIGDVRHAMLHNKWKTIVLGVMASASILLPYFLVTKTSFLFPKPITCQALETANMAYPSGWVEVCIVGVSREYSPENGDVDLDVQVKQPNGSIARADVNFWVADMIGNKKVNYAGEYNIHRIRTYEKGFLTNDRKENLSSWVQPLVPADARESLWNFVHSIKHTFVNKKMPLDERISGLVENSGAYIAAGGSLGLALYRFLRFSG